MELNWGACQQHNSGSVMGAAASFGWGALRFLLWNTFRAWLTLASRNAAVMIVQRPSSCCATRHAAPSWHMLTWQLNP